MKLRWKRKEERKYDVRSQILSFVVMECPLCKEPFRTKTMLRIHLNKHHNLYECEKFLNKNDNSNNNTQ